MLSLLAPLLLAASPVHAQDRLPAEALDVGSLRAGGDLGVGISVGAPSGFVLRGWLPANLGGDVTVGADLGRVGELSFAGDVFAFVQPVDTGVEDYAVLAHVGAGFRARWNQFEWGGYPLLGPRLLAGIDIVVRDLPVDVFVDVAPTLYVYRAVTWGVDGRIGSCFYF